MTEFFPITLRTNVINFSLKTSEVKDELRKYCGFETLQPVYPTITIVRLLPNNPSKPLQIDT